MSCESSTKAELVLNRISKRQQAGRCYSPQTQAERQILSTLTATGRIVRPIRGMYMTADYFGSLSQNPHDLWRTIQYSYIDEHPEETLCLYSAALHFGLWIPNSCLGKIYLASNDPGHGWTKPEIRHVHCRRGSIDIVNGVSTTTLYQTAMDCMLKLAFPEALAVADSVQRLYGISNEELKRYLRQHGVRRHGIARARMAVEHMDGRSENGGESIVRGKLIELGFAPPTDLQVEARDPIMPDKKMRIDMMYLLPSGARIAVEVDGMIKYRGENSASGKPVEDVLVAERQRESHLTAAGYRVMRVLFKRINEPGYLEQLCYAFNIPSLPSVSLTY